MKKEIHIKEAIVDFCKALIKTLVVLIAAVIILRCGHNIYRGSVNAYNYYGVLGHSFDPIVIVGEFFVGVLCVILIASLFASTGVGIVFSVIAIEAGIYFLYTAMRDSGFLFFIIAFIELSVGIKIISWVKDFYEDWEDFVLDLKGY